MGNYYFLAPSLPPLKLGHIPEISSAELFARLEINLNKEDLKKTAVLRRFTDINNIRALLLEEAIDPRGNFTEKELDEALLVKSEFPEYIFDFLEKYDTRIERLKNFPELLSHFFREEVPKEDGFLHRYLNFEREWRLVMIGLRSKQAKKDVARELQFEDFKDSLVAQILAQKDDPEYEPPAVYADLKALFLAHSKDPWQQYKAFAEWRFDKIRELIDKPLFSIDWILGYMARLLIVEQWNELDKEKGLMILNTFKAR